MNTREAHALIAAARSFVHGFIDHFNAPSEDYMVPAERDGMIRHASDS